MNLYKVSFGGEIEGSNDYTYLMANDAYEALEKGKKLLNTHKLIPDFLNDYSGWNVMEVQA